ncbi:glycosyltransferase family 4 protein [Clostridium malenominatum]|uniref:Glycosyltransferase family 4 protein n=1 Tax=Clostridium malenominatum TaxID=1539 RepID=A0ABP3TY37_9CLOT
MKICMLTSGHDVYDNRIYYKEILSLQKVYDEIYIVAPGDKDFITEDGVIVKCFPKRKNWRDRFRPMKDMYNIAKKIGAEVYHAHEPDSFQVAVKLKKNFGSKIIYDSHEYYPEAFSEHFPKIKGLMEKVIYTYEKTLAKKADCIITVNDILVDKFKKYHSNVQLLPNYPVLKDKEIVKEYNDIPTFIYVGGLREDRGIYKTLEAIKLVKVPCKYIFIGPFESEIFKLKCEEYIRENLNNKDIVFTGKIPHIEVFEYLKSSHAGFVLLQPNNWRYVNAEPIKLFEYMITKNVVIGSDFPMIRNIIEPSGSGLLVDPYSPEDIASAMERLAENIEETKLMGEKGFIEVNHSYNWAVCEERLLSAYSALK